MSGAPRALLGSAAVRQYGGLSRVGGGGLADVGRGASARVCCGPMTRPRACATWQAAVSPSLERSRGTRCACSGTRRWRCWMGRISTRLTTSACRSGVACRQAGSTAAHVSRACLMAMPAQGLAAAERQRGCRAQRWRAEWALASGCQGHLCGGSLTSQRPDPCESAPPAACCAGRGATGRSQGHPLRGLPAGAAAAAQALRVRLHAGRHGQGELASLPMRQKLRSKSAFRNRL